MRIEMNGTTFSATRRGLVRRLRRAVAQSSDRSSHATAYTRSGAKYATAAGGRGQCYYVRIEAPRENRGVYHRMPVPQ